MYKQWWEFWNYQLSLVFRTIFYEYTSHPLNTEIIAAINIPTSNRIHQDQRVITVHVNNGLLFAESHYIFKDNMWAKCGVFKRHGTFSKSDWSDIKGESTKDNYFFNVSFTALVRSNCHSIRSESIQQRKRGKVHVCISPFSSETNITAVLSIWILLSLASNNFNQLLSYIRFLCTNIVMGVQV